MVQWQYNQTLFSVSEIVRSAAAHVTNTLLTENWDSTFFEYQNIMSRKAAVTTKTPRGVESHRQPQDLYSRERSEVRIYLSVKAADLMQRDTNNFSFLIKTVFLPPKRCRTSGTFRVFTSHIGRVWTELSDRPPSRVMCPISTIVSEVWQRQILFGN